MTQRWQFGQLLWGQENFNNYSVIQIRIQLILKHSDIDLVERQGINTGKEMFSDKSVPYIPHVDMSLYVKQIDLLIS